MISKNPVPQHFLEDGPPLPGIFPCAWCYKQYPERELSPVTTEVDPETGMSASQEEVCQTCLRSAGLENEEEEERVP